jgi:hypothetical protein
MRIFACLAFAAASVMTLFGADVTAQDGLGIPPDRRTVELDTLRRIYPPGYSDAAISSIEDGMVPETMSVPEYSRLHCGEMGEMVFNPCMVSYPGEYGTEFVVISQGGNRRIATREEAATYFRDQLSDTVMTFESEVSAINTFVDTLCDHMAGGGDIREVLPPRSQWPRIDHPIAPPNRAAKKQFSDLFTWEKCESCVGIVAVNLADELPPTCANLSKQAAPRIAYFVVDRETSRGHGDIVMGLDAWVERISNK